LIPFTFWLRSQLACALQTGCLITTGVCMKKIEAIIKPFKLDEVKEALQ
jgi:hypothetical protein